MERKAIAVLEGGKLKLVDADVTGNIAQLDGVRYRAQGDVSVAGKRYGFFKPESRTRKPPGDCQRCAGTGQFGNHGVCYDCGGTGRKSTS